MSYLFKVITGFSFFLNAALGGSPYETFCSSQYARKKQKKVNLVAVIDFFGGKDHCLLCYTNTLIRKERGYKHDNY